MIYLQPFTASLMCSYQVDWQRLSFCMHPCTARASGAPWLASRMSRSGMSA